jgi:hypothetical protein
MLHYVFEKYCACSPLLDIVLGWQQRARSNFAEFFRVVTSHMELKMIGSSKASNTAWALERFGASAKQKLDEFE